jgi:MFS family permease
MSRINIISLTACIGGFLFGYDSAIISGILVQPSFAVLYGTQLDDGSFIIAPETAGDVASILQLGGFIGVLFQPFFNDNLGRKNTLIYLSAVFTIGAIIQAFAETV